MKQELRNFGLIMATMFGLFFGLLLPWLWGHALPLWPWIVAVVFLLPAVVYPLALKPVHVVWMKVGHVLGWINTRIILSLIFYLAFTPIALVMKMTGRDPMARDYEAEADSYRIPTPAKSAKDLERPF